MASAGSGGSFDELVARVVEDSHRTEPLPRSEFDRATSDRVNLFAQLRCPDSISLRNKAKVQR